jgi:elongation factor P--beta-lysine ligase
LPLAKIEKAANENGAFKIWLRTAPEYGNANKAVVAILGELLGMSFRRCWRSHESCRCDDHRIHFGIMAAIGSLAGGLLLD